MKFFILFIANFLLLSVIYAEDKKIGSLSIHVSNIKQIKGDIHIGVFANEPDYRQKTNQVKKGIYPVLQDTLVVEYEGLTVGSYAIIIFHDLNKNDKMDSTGIGIPIEPFGFSNNVSPGFGLPAFEKAMISVREGKNTTDIELQKYKKKWSVGLAGLYSTSPYKEDEGRFYPIPVISYQGEKLSIIGPQIFYTVLRKNDWTLDLALRLQFNGYTEDDSETFEDMDDRNLTLEGGISLTWKPYRDIKVQLESFGDLLLQHKGFHGKIGIGNSFKYRKMTFTPSLGLEWQSNKFVQYYYGVEPHEEKFNRNAYHPSAHINPYLAFSVMVPFKQSWLFTTTITGRVFTDEILDSPLIDDSYQLNFLAAVVYQF